MLLSIKEMEVKEVRFDETFPPGEIDFSGSEVTQTGPLHVEGVAELLQNTGGEVRIKGRMTTTIEAVCDRCLGTATFPIDAPFDLFYRPEADLPSEDEIAIDEGEAEIAFYREPGLVLEDVLCEQIMLQLPMQRVCSEDCEGICPICGLKRSETACRCTEARADDRRWSALRNL
jgi:uncharacterized protein